MACVKCHRGMLGTDQRYVVVDLGPELLSIIKQQISHHIPDDAILCEKCFISVTNSLANTNLEEETAIKIESVDVVPSVKNACVWCQLSLTTRRSHVLPIGRHRDAVSAVIAPRQVCEVYQPAVEHLRGLSSNSPHSCVGEACSLQRDVYRLILEAILELPRGGHVCHRCWSRVCRLLGGNSVTVQNVCVCCGCSLTNRRTHNIPMGPERDEIAERIAPREILPEDRVCYACWVSARRSVAKAKNADSHNKSDCIMCCMSVLRRRTHLVPAGQIRDVVSKRIYPRQITVDALLCKSCWAWVQNAIRAKHEQPQIESNEDGPIPTLDMPRHIQLNSYKKVGASSSRCFVPGCKNIERLTVPEILKKHLLNSLKVYVANNARVCTIHKTANDWEHIIDVNNLSNVFSVEEIEEIMEIQ